MSGSSPTWPLGPLFLSPFGLGPFGPWGSAPFGNLSFEIAGSEPGDAQDWFTEFVGTAFEQAAYGTPAAAYEGYEAGWLNDAYLLALDEVDAAAYAYKNVTQDLESFESLWDGNDGYLLALAATEQGVYGVGAAAEEDFEAEWDNGAYLLALGATASGTGETFESGWAQTGYKTEFVGIGTDLEAAVFDFENVPQAFEDFENVKRDQAWALSAGAPTDTLLCEAHGFQDDDGVTVYASVGDSGVGQLPSPLTEGRTYYAIEDTADTLKLSLSQGGAPITLTDSGIGQLFLKAYPGIYWTLDEGDV